MKKLYACEANCWNCNEKIKIAYGIYEKDDIHIVVTPESFTQQDIDIAKKHNIKIETIGYGSGYTTNVIKANVCPKCNKPFGNSHIKELENNPREEIK